MKKLLLSILISSFFFSTASAQWSWDNIKKKAEGAYKDAIKTNRSLSHGEVIRGLKEALSVGTHKATKRASQVNGYYQNPRIRIPFPPDAQKVKSVVEKLGMKSQVDKFVLTLNRAAEEAAKQAAPILLNAIKGMTIQDGFEILNGPNNAATSYLKRKTSRPLTVKFKPIVKRAMDKVKVTKYWHPIITKYNQIPFAEQKNPHLDDYVTQKALNGLFKLIASEELRIRKNPAARVTELLKRVFGSK